MFRVLRRELNAETGRTEAIVVVRNRRYKVTYDDKRVSFEVFVELPSGRGYALVRRFEDKDLMVECKGSDSVLEQVVFYMAVVDRLWQELQHQSLPLHRRLWLGLCRAVKTRRGG